MALSATGINWGRVTRNSTKESDTDLTQPKEILDSNAKDDEKTQEPSEESVSEDNESMEDEQKSLHDSVKTLKTTIEQLTVILNAVDSKFQVQENKLSFLYHKCEALSAQNQLLTDKIDQLENRHRLTNLKIDGLREEEGENLRDKVKKLAESMGSNCQLTDIDSVFRLGKQDPNQKRGRPVMIKFKTVSTRHEFYNQRFSLKNQKQWDRIWINEDVTDNTRRRKEAMRSISILCRLQTTLRCHCHQRYKIPHQRSRIYSSTILTQ